MYRQLDIQLPTGPGPRVFHSPTPSGRDLRKVLARLNTEYEMGLPAWFFGYGEDGKPDCNTRPQITMGDNAPGSVRILALGPQASDLLNEKSGTIQAALIRASQQLVHASMRSGPHKIDDLKGVGSPTRHYRLHRLVVGKTTHESFWWRSAKRVEAGGDWSERDFVALSRLIGTGILEQAQTLLQGGDDIGGGLGEWLETKLATDDTKDSRTLFMNRLGVKVTGIAGWTAHRATGPQGLRVMLKGVEFTAAAGLEGPWVVGRNRIEGYGLIRRSSNPPVLQAQAQAHTLEAAL